MYMKLIFINVLVFLFINLISVIGRLTESSDLFDLVSLLFTLETDFNSFLFRPWGLFTSIFSHVGFMHLAFNMLMLFFMGQAFERYFGSRRLLSVYIIGGIAGGILEIVAHAVFPALLYRPSVVLGASGSIMAIFIGLAFYKPNLPLSFFGLFQLRIIYLGIIYLMLDILNLGADDGTAHFAHLGGAIIGILAAQQPMSSRNFIARLENWFVQLWKKNPQRKKKKSGFNYNQQARKKTDEEYNVDAKRRQEKIDAILDKISRSGYESLSKAEKEFLFRQSDKNGS